MLDKSVRDKRDDLRIRGVRLRELVLDTTDYSKTMELITKQNEIYRRWKYYNKLIKSIEREEYETNRQRYKKHIKNINCK